MLMKELLKSSNIYVGREEPKQAMVNEQQQTRTVQWGAERALAMLRNASANSNGKKPWVLDCSRKRGRPRKEHGRGEATVIDLTEDRDHSMIQDPVENALDQVHAHLDQSDKIKKRNYIRWTNEDRQTILEKLQEFKGKGEKHPIAATVKYFTKHRGPVTGGTFPEHYQKLRDSHLHSWTKVKENVVGRKPGRPPRLKPETRNAIIQHIKHLFQIEHDSRGSSTHVVVNSTTLIPQIQEVIRKHGEGSALDDGTLKVSRSWVNDLCKNLRQSRQIPKQQKNS
jgi:hypothetical protein